MSRANAEGDVPVVLYSVAAEEVLLGSLLLDTSAWLKISPLKITSRDFYRPDHQVIFNAIERLELDGKAHDSVLTFAELKRTGDDAAAGGIEYLRKLVRETATSENVVEYATHVRERSTLRDLRVDLERTSDEIAKGADAASVLETAGRLVKHLRSRILAPAKSLPTTPVSVWATQPEPPARDFVFGNFIPARRVTSLLADGGTGKTTIAVQIGVHVSAGQQLWGQAVNGGPVVGIFCEDEPEELQRKVRACVRAEHLSLDELDRFIAISRDGQDNLLCTFRDDEIRFTAFHQELEATVAEIRPRLLILDTLADVFGGNMLELLHVRQFIKVLLGGLCSRYDCAVLLVAHPSAAGVTSGDGGGYSVGWHNSVRSRLFMRRPRSEDKDAIADRRVLESRKANYAAAGSCIPLLWQDGCFVPDPEPLEDGGQVVRAKIDTRLSIAVHDFFRAASGNVVTFKALFERMQGAGHLPSGPYENVRKPLQRALRALVGDGVLKQTAVPRGYRLVPEARDVP
jgi:hypothetical protein